MNELEKQRAGLDKLYYLVNSLNIFKCRLPPAVFHWDLNEMIKDIQYLSGYIDCMLKFEIEPLPEPEDI